MDRDVVRAHLDLLLLAVLSSGPLHGYALIDALRERSDGGFVLQEGTVYPALHRLEGEGLLASRWSLRRGRRRRVYRLTRKGRKALADGRREWRELSDRVELVLEASR
jgi:DNA-binding PadR family transcriptional regulator